MTEKYRKSEISKGRQSTTFLPEFEKGLPQPGAGWVKNTKGGMTSAQDRI